MYTVCSNMEYTYGDGLTAGSAIIQTRALLTHFRNVYVLYITGARIWCIWCVCLLHIYMCTCVYWQTAYSSIERNMTTHRVIVQAAGNPDQFRAQQDVRQTRARLRRC